MQAQAKYLQWDLHIYTGKRKEKQEGWATTLSKEIYKMQPQPQYDRNAIDNTMHNIKWKKQYSKHFIISKYWI